MAASATGPSILVLGQPDPVSSYLNILDISFLFATHNMSGSDKQVVEHDQKEAVIHTSVQPQPQEYVHRAGHEKNDKAGGSRKILFWIVIPLAILLVGAVIGGAVGGSLAVQNAR